jgi:transposase
MPNTPAVEDGSALGDAGDHVFAPSFKRFLQKASAIGRRRADLADATIKTYARQLRAELDRLLALKPADRAGNDLRCAISVTARDKLLVFLTQRDPGSGSGASVEPTNNASEQALRMSVVFRRVTNGFRSVWGAKLYADQRSIVATGRLAGRSPLVSLRAALA